MEIILGKTIGFCFGVANSVKKAEKECQENGETYCLGDLVNNKQAIKELEEQGLKVINSLDEMLVGAHDCVRLRSRAQSCAPTMHHPCSWSIKTNI